MSEVSTDVQLPDWVLAIVACPVPDCRSPLRWDRHRSVLVCIRCGREYPIIDGILPLLVTEERTCHSDSSP